MTTLTIRDLRSAAGIDRLAKSAIRGGRHQGRSIGACCLA